MKAAPSRYRLTRNAGMNAFWVTGNVTNFPNDIAKKLKKNVKHLR